MITPLTIWKAGAHGLFRWTAFFLAAVVAWRLDGQIGTATLLIIFIVDVSTYNLVQVATYSADSVYTRQWFDTLTNRLFFGRLLNAVKEGSHIDTDYMFREATKESAADVTKFREDEDLKIQLGGFSKFMLSVWSYIWLCLSYGLFYGAAAFVGGALR